MRALLVDNVPSSIPSQPVARLVGHEGPVQAVCFTANGKYCLTAGHDRTVRLWNPARMDPAFPQPEQLPPKAGRDIPIQSLPRALPIHSYSDGHAHPVSAIAIDETSTTLLSASDKTLVWTDVVSQSVQRRFHGHDGRINAVCISKHCETFLSASYDGTVRIWDARSKSPHPIQLLSQARDSVTGVDTLQHLDGEAYIRTCSVDGNVRTFDLRKGLLQCDNVDNAIFSMALTHDAQCLAISCLDGTIRLMEAETGELLNVYNKHHVAGNYALSCQFTADDAHVVTGSEDGRVVLYDLVRGERVQELLGHLKPTCSVACHPLRSQSSVVVSASYDGSAIVWANDASYIQYT